GVAGPHGSSNAMMRLEPGRYAWICLMNSPLDRLPHVMKGMAHPFVVRAAGDSAATPKAPEASAVLQLVEYGFSLSAPLTAGRRVIRVENSGAEAHDVGLVKLAPGRSMQDLDTWLKTREGPPPASPVGGVSPLSPGADAYFEVDLMPGDYAFICLVTAPD